MDFLGGTRVSDGAPVRCVLAGELSAIKPAVWSERRSPGCWEDPGRSSCFSRLPFPGRRTPGPASCPGRPPRARGLWGPVLRCSCRAAGRGRGGRKHGQRLFPAEKGRGHGAAPGLWACGLSGGLRTPEPALGAPAVGGPFCTRPVTLRVCGRQVVVASGGRRAACAPGVGSGLGPGCGPSSRLPRLEQVVQSRPRSGPREKGGRRGGSLKWLLQEPGWHHTSPACVLVGHLLLGMSGLVVENESQAREAPSTVLARPLADLAPCSWPQGDGSVHRRWWDSQGRGIRAAGPWGLRPSPHLLLSSRILLGPFCSWTQKGTTPVLSDVFS